MSHLMPPPSSWLTYHLRFRFTDILNPRTIMTICVGKSTYARCGIITNVTPFEPEWEGHVTLEISNTTPLPAKIYADEGISQVLFFESDEPCEVSYGDRKGKYQGDKPSYNHNLGLLFTPNFTDDIGHNKGQRIGQHAGWYDQFPHCDYFTRQNGSQYQAAGIAASQKDQIFLGSPRIN